MGFTGEIERNPRSLEGEGYVIPGSAQAAAQNRAEPPDVIAT
jgi:hypothetical protein